MRFKGVNIVLLCLVLSSCGNDEKQTEKTPINWGREKSTQLHKEQAITDDIYIRAYIERHKDDYKFESTGSGLRYAIYEIKEGQRQIVKGDEVCLALDIKLLDGEIECYKTEENECRQIKVDQSDAESGLLEVLPLMKLGEKAKIILPYHLAHGLLGDRDKIPPLSVLLIDVQVVEIE